MKEIKLTQTMLLSLKEDPSLATFEEWKDAGDYAAQIRFFPHAFKCFHNAFELKKTEEITEKLNDVLDKMTNVLEILPADMKEIVEPIRFNNPLDPSKWLEISNQLLKTAKDKDDKNPSLEHYKSAKIALAFCVYSALRSANDVEEMNKVLVNLIEPVSLDNATFEKLSIQVPRDRELRVVAMGDNVTLGLQHNWDVKFEETYHYLWAHECGKDVTLANCGISGAGMMDALLYLGRDAINYRPDLVFLNFGINDAWLGFNALPAYEVLVESVIELLKPHCQVALITPVPHIPEACPATQRPTTVDLKEVEIEPWVVACKRVALRTNTALVDAYAEFPPVGGDRAKYFANGFNQLTLEGHRLILDAINKTISLN